MENKMESDIESIIRGFPKLGGYHLGVHILRIMIFWDVYWGLPCMATTISDPIACSIQISSMGRKAAVLNFGKPQIPTSYIIPVYTSFSICLPN